MVRRAVVTTTISTILLLTFISGAGAFDLVQFTTNYIWCWQHDYDLIGINDPEMAKRCQQGDPTACEDQRGQTHAFFISLVMKDYSRLDWTPDYKAEVLREFYRYCQHHNPRALDYMTVSNSDLLRGVRHMIACYPPHKAAAKLADGSPATAEGQSIGPHTCEPL